MQVSHRALANPRVSTCKYLASAAPCFGKSMASTCKVLCKYLASVLNELAKSTCKSTYKSRIMYLASAASHNSDLIFNKYLF